MINLACGIVALLIVMAVFTLFASALMDNWGGFLLVGVAVLAKLAWDSLHKDAEE